MDALDMASVALDAIVEPTHYQSPETMYMLRQYESEAWRYWCDELDVVDAEIEQMIQVSRNYEEFLDSYIEMQCRL